MIPMAKDYAKMAKMWRTEEKRSNDPKLIKIARQKAEDLEWMSKQGK